MLCVCVCVCMMMIISTIIIIIYCCCYYYYHTADTRTNPAPPPHPPPPPPSLFMCIYIYLSLPPLATVLHTLGGEIVSRQGAADGRHLLTRQKRPMYKAKETYVDGKRDLSQGAAHGCNRRGVHWNAHYGYRAEVPAG
jgi:hypothetical protein